LDACAHLECRNLLIGDVFERLGQQVHTVLLVMLAHPPPKVVQAPQFKVPFAKLIVTQRIAHLHVIAKMIVELIVAPSKTSLEHFQPHQHIDGYVGPRWQIRIQHGKRFLANAHEDLPAKCPGPRVF